MKKNFKRLQIMSLIYGIICIVALLVFLIIGLVFQSLDYSKTASINVLYSAIGALALITISYTCIFVFVQFFSSRKAHKNEITGVEILGRDLQETYNFGQIGMCVTDDKDIVIWSSEFLQEKGIDIVDTNIFDFNDKLAELKNSNDDNLLVKITFKSHTYEVKYIKDAHIFMFRDITKEDVVYQINRNQSPVVGFAIIDNYSDIQQSADQTTFINLIGESRKAISNYFKENGSLIHQISDTTYIFTTTRENFDKIAASQFKIVDEIKQIKVEGFNDFLTLSIGASYGVNDYNKLSDLARSAIDVSLSRGGDQIVIAPFSQAMIFIGGKSDARASHNKVKMRMKADALITNMEHSDNVLIVGHKYADFDAIGAALGVQQIAESICKQARVYIEDNLLERNVRRIYKTNFTPEQIEQYFVFKKDVEDYITPNTLLIVVDCNSEDMIMNKELCDLISKKGVIDHHRPGDKVIKDTIYNASDTSASSTCEIVTFLIYQSTRKLEITEMIATFMLSGILLDTNHYKQKTSSYTFDASSILKQFGANNEKADDFLKEEWEEYLLKLKIKQFYTIPKPGMRIYAYEDEDDNTIDQSVLAQVAQETLNIRDMDCCFAIGKISENLYKISARSNGSINVQFIMEKLAGKKGGGHLTAAAAVLEADNIDVVKQELEEIIEDYYDKAQTTSSENE